jgi:threonine dehydrogenase-like Zn-dependent dehydrogenase
MPEPPAGAGEVLVRALEVGVCGTDKEIDAGAFGTPPPGEEDLILGHELLGVVERDAEGFAAGDLVTATVRRGCGACLACEQDAADSCLTGDYAERGINRLHGFGSELVVERAEHLVRVPPALGRLGVLAEPSSVCERAIRHAWAIGERQPWRPRRALVVGAGAIGMLTTYLLRLRGLDVVTASRGPRDGPKARLALASGAEYVSTARTPLRELTGFDVVVEATGDAQVMHDVLSCAGRSGVVALLGVDASRKPVDVDSGVIGVQAVVQSRALFGSVNAHHRDWTAAVARLEELQRRWPDELAAFVAHRRDPADFRAAFDERGVKATLRFG